MKNICIYFQVHQPYRLKRFRIFDIGNGTHYFDDEQNRAILRKVAQKCYLPTNQLLLDLIKRTEGQFKVAFSLSGALLKQLVAEAPEVLASFQELAATGSVEILGETYFHSLSAIGHKDEFIEQVDLHRGTIERLFGQRPRVFRNTELIYFDELAPLVADMGFKAILAEGADKVLQWRSPNYVYETTTAPGLKLLLRNYRLSDDVGFRFSERNWEGWPVTAEKHTNWIAASPGETVNLFMDYETFGEHQWAETGIFDFLKKFPLEAERRGLKFVNPSELAGRTPAGALSFPTPTSWADVERDLSAWLGNRLQKAAHERLYKLRPAVMATGDQDLIEQWRKLSTSDHFYYICTKWFADGDVHKYFNPYETPYDAFMAFMNVMQDLEQRVETRRLVRETVETTQSTTELALVGAV